MATTNSRQPRRNNVRELENAFHNLSDKPRSKGSSGVVPYLIIAFCLITIVAVVAVIMGLTPNNTDPSANNSTQQQDEKALIPGKISVAGVDLEGMTIGKAKESLQKVFSQKYANKDFSFTVDSQAIAIPYSVSGVSLDFNRLSKALLSHKPEEAKKELNLKDYILVDRAAIAKTITDLLPNFDLTQVPSSYEVKGTAPNSYTAIDSNASLTLKLTKGRPGRALDADVLSNQIIQCILNEKWELSYDISVSDPKEIDFAGIYAEHCTAPKDAVYGNKFKVIPGTYGYGFQVEDVKKTYDAMAFGETKEIPFTWIEPENTTEELSSALFRDVLGTYETHANSGYNRNVNLKLAAKAINGIILYPGDTFSYNGALGERTKDKGYLPGVSYINGMSVEDIGGGICQVTSTLYYCTILADLKILERECHDYRSSYTPLSTDATVFWGGIDFRFQNNWNYPIRIDAHTDGGSVYVSLYGTDEKDYTVNFEWEQTGHTPAVREEREIPADNNPKGYKDGELIIDGYDGYTSNGYRARYDKETGELIDRVLESEDKYKVRNWVYCKIIPAEPEPSEPEAPDTSEPEEDTPPVDETPGGGEEPTPTEDEEPLPVRTLPPKESQILYPCQRKPGRMG